MVEATKEHRCEGYTANGVVCPNRGCKEGSDGRWYCRKHNPDQQRPPPWDGGVARSER